MTNISVNVKIYIYIYYVTNTNQCNVSANVSVEIVDSVIRNLNPLTAKFIYLATSAACAGPINRPTAVG